MNRKIVLSSNTALSIYGFRLGFMKKLRNLGFDVIAVASYDEYAENIEKEGFGFVNVNNLDRKGKNPIKDFKLLLEYRRIYKEYKPDLVVNYTIKPNIYGSIAAHLNGIPSISVVTGLGYVFMKESPLTKLVRFLYKIALRYNDFIVFQNEDDIKEIASLINPKKVRLIKSSGVNLDWFSQDVCNKLSLPKKEGFVFLYTGRFLKDKGILELIDASKKLREKDHSFSLWLLGSIDTGNPASLTEDDLKHIKDLPFVKVFPFAKDVRPYLCVADCVVLPSYREGVPRSLLEALSMGKPIITTNSVGCKEVCIDKENGFLVRPKDVESLFLAMKTMLNLSEEERKSMGARGREFAKEFDEEKIINKYIEIIEEVLNA